MIGWAVDANLLGTTARRATKARILTIRKQLRSPRQHRTIAPMLRDAVLLLTDVENSTQITEQLGDEAASELWSAHDQVARRLLRRFGGREIDKSDGFLLLFGTVDAAAAFALALHDDLAQLQPPLACRAGIHHVALVERENAAEDVAMGAKSIELDGVGKAVTSRIMAIARGGQTLLSADARAVLGTGPWRCQSHGHWRMKGLAQPIELFELAEVDAPMLPPPDSAKSYRVLRSDDGWIPRAELHHGLPAERDPFVGRGDALSSLAGHFDGGARLITVLGIGGIGKTRLVLRYARCWLGDYPGGAWFCDLSAARGVDGVVHAVAQGLEVPLGKDDPVQQLGAAIAGRGPCLVVLDNFEQVARHAEATLGRWLERAPQATFLATSREVLGIVGEQAYVLATLGRDEAVQLFERRAQAADSERSFEPDERALLPTLVDLLDRLPLAIELAAARIGVMGPQAMLDRMGERFKLLASQGGRHDRQATMRATLDWSWELLSPAEQSALAQLSVFEGGFTLESAEAVVRTPTGDGSLLCVDLVESLLQRSLLRRQGRRRFDMLRTVHDYATEQLAASLALGDAGNHCAVAVARRHWQHFAAKDELSAANDRCADLENLLIACRRASSQDPGSAAGLLLAAWAAMKLTGPFRAALGLAEDAKQHATPDSALLLACYRVMAGACMLLGQRGQARKHLMCATKVAQASADRIANAQVWCQLADLDLSEGYGDDAWARLDAAASVAEESGDLLLDLRVRNHRGRLCMAQSRMAEAEHWYRRALERARALGDRRWVGGLHGNLGALMHVTGALDTAKEHYALAVAIAAEVGDRQWEGNGRCNLGLLLQEIGQFEAAKRELEDALTIGRGIGHQRLEATCLCNLAIVFESLAMPEAARAHYHQAVEAARANADQMSEGEFLGYLGLLCARVGRGEEAHRTLHRADELLQHSNDPGRRGLLAAQRALAAALLGNSTLANSAMSQAESLLGPLPFGSTSFAGRLMVEASQAVHGPAQTVPALGSANRSS